MYCISCGTDLPDEASFCWKCGKPHKQDNMVEQTEKVQEVKYETCEIFYKTFYEGTFGDDGYFVANAIDPEGTYAAGYSEKFSVGKGEGPDINKKKPAHAHHALVNKLTSQGWEQSDRGLNWHNIRLRRRIDPYWDRCIIDYDVIKRGIFTNEMKFWARAGGIRGGYNAGDSTIFKDADSPTRVYRETINAHRSLIEKLKADGWEPIETERFEKYGWWLQRFKRLAK